MPMLTLSPYFSNRRLPVSITPRPRYGDASSKLTWPSLVILITVHSALAPSSVRPQSSLWPSAKENVPPAFDSLTPPVIGLLQPTLVRLAFEKFDPANGPAEKISGFSGDSGSIVATPR